jgi:SAM-dependent methyltransferase
MAVLDYGCGDGTFLAMLMNSDHAPSSALGVDIDATLIAGCSARFQNVNGLGFAQDAALATGNSTFDAIFCMEVLEHVIDSEPLLQRFEELLAPGGALLISVPVEIGLPILLKQMVRRVAGWRGLGDYPGTSPYTWSELATSVFAGARQHIRRPVHRHSDGAEFYDHKGFNWRLLEERLKKRFYLPRRLTSPLRSFGPQFASQIWWSARKRSDKPGADGLGSSDE